jgi:site-specific DNA-methyltransferase (cytosine-N4-specific)
VSGRDTNRTGSTLWATRLSRLHPYPAMVADELAFSLVRDHVPPQASVLDPFCGSGRLLVAAEGAALRVGIDTNPLAWLLTKAKLAPARHTILGPVVAQLKHKRRTAPAGPACFLPDRKVDWFTSEVLFELRRIVGWINSLELEQPERLLVAASLSATIREVSFARQNGWKLHRLDPDARSAFEADPWTRLERRLLYCLKELRARRDVQGDTHIALSDARALSCWQRPCKSYLPLRHTVTRVPPYNTARPLPYVSRL